MAIFEAIKSESGTPERGVDMKRKRSEGLDGCSTSQQCQYHASLPKVNCQASSTSQYVHQSMLAVDTDHQRNSWSQEVIVPIADGRTSAYCRWWSAEAARDDLSLLSVRLIGDASSPQVFTAVAQNDLAYLRCAFCLPKYGYLLWVVHFTAL